MENKNYILNQIYSAPELGNLILKYVSNNDKLYVFENQNKAMVYHFTPTSETFFENLPKQKFKLIQKKDIKKDIVFEYGLHNHL